MEIRPVLPSDDRLAISHIYEESWKYAYKGIIPQSYLDSIPAGHWASHADSEGMHTLLMLEGDSYIGTASFCASRFEQFCGFGEIVSIYLLPEYIGRGCGRSLLSAAIAGLTKLGFQNIFLWVLEDNSRAITFYEKAGFVPCGTYLDDCIGGKPLREAAYQYHAASKALHNGKQETNSAALGRPALDRTLSSAAFRDFYYLKEELVDFCRKNALPSSGGKLELTERIARYLDTGEIQAPSPAKKGSRFGAEISVDTLIEPNLVCSEKHRAFFREHIGSSFSFNVTFQKWLKGSAGKTYGDAISAYHQIIEEKKHGKSEIDRQFEYNTYIRDFFADNRGRSLRDAIKCWKYKKQLQGHNRYERSDLSALED